MRTINYESDFKLVVGFNDGTSITVAPFRFTFYTKASRGTLVAEYDGTEYTNCYPTEDGRVRIPFDGHKLGTGLLSAKVQFFLDDSDFADGKYDWVSEESTRLVLDKGATDTFEDFEWVISRPNTRGLEMSLERPYINTGAGGDIPNGSITTAKIKDGAVTEDKLSEEVKEKLNKAGGQGEKGDDGKSAYEIWLEQGNEGSEQDFLDSLKGEKGADGEKGDKGDQGERGEQGIQGEKGDKMTYDDLTEEEKEDLASRVPAPDVDVPTKTSQLTNDSGYITEGRVEEMIDDKVTSANVTNIVSITQADYDALETKSETTLYLITE